MGECLRASFALRGPEMRWIALRLGIVAGCFIAASASYASRMRSIRTSSPGKSTFWIKGPDNVSAEEKAHDLRPIDRVRCHPRSTSLNLAAGKNEANYAYYYYPTPPPL